MPVAVSYPGVYVQPLITQAPTDQGVATSITAFVGRAFMGPENVATPISSFADFQRIFGGLSADFPLSYAVNDFYNNGGGAAIIVRLYAPYYASPAVLAEAQAVVTDLQTAVAKATSGADAIKAMAAEIAKLPSKKFNDYQQAVAAQIQTAFTASVTPTMAGAELQAAEQAAYATVVRQTTATLTINVVNTVQTAAQALYNAAVAAAASSPDNAAVVQTAVVRTANALAASAPAVAATVLSAVKATVTAALPNAPTTGGGGTWLALQTAVAIPPATQSALQLATTASLKAINTDFTAALAVAKAGVTAAGAASATAQTVQAAIATAAKGAPAGSAATAAGTVLAAADASVAAGGGPNDIAAAAELATLTVISNDWPSTLTLQAANDGSWGDSLSATVDYQGQTAGSGLFNLTVTYVTPAGLITTEQFRSVSIDPTQPNANRLDVVLQTTSNFVRVPVVNGQPSFPAVAPDDQGSGQGQGGSDSNPLGLTDYLGDQSQKTGIYALEQVPLFNILCIPPDQAGGDTQPYIYQVAAEYCFDRRAMLIIDPPGAWYDLWVQGSVSSIALSSLGSFSPGAARASAIYFPRMVAVDPLQGGQQAVFPASGAIAGIWAATDISRGVWKAPAGLQAAINTVVGLQANLTDAECGILNPQGINCLRISSVGDSVVWGARTMQGADILADEYKYIPVQRMLLYISNSLLANTQWAVFEPNDEPLWAQLRLSIGVFMANLFRQGAFQGQTADEAYFVKCDSTTTTQADIDAGIVNVQVGFAPLKPAEFVVITIQQIAGQSS